MKSFFPVLVLVAVLVLVTVPVSAWGEQYSLTNIPLYKNTKTDFIQKTSVTFDASTLNEKIALMSFTIPEGTTVTLTIYYGNNSVVTATSENHKIDLLRTSSTVTIGGVTKTYSYIDTQPFYDFNFAGYAKDTNTTPETTGFLIYSLNYGSLDNDLAAFYPVDNIQINTIYRIDATGTKPFDLFITSGEPSTVAGGAGESVLDVLWKWINFGISVGGTVYSLAVETFTWLLFIWNNLVLIISLYIAMTMAFAARNSRGNIAKFYRTFFSDQKKLFEFILGLWQTFTIIISNMRSLFKL